MAAMIIEYIRYTIPPGSAAEFEAAYQRAAVNLDASPQCLGYELSRCVEEHASYILRIEWKSIDEHMQGFRKGDQFAAFFKSIEPYLEQIEEMRHYQHASVVSTKQ
jgi:quinol monooxygenase YgiN